MGHVRFPSAAVGAFRGLEPGKGAAAAAAAAIEETLSGPGGEGGKEKKNEIIYWRRRRRPEGLFLREIEREREKRDNIEKERGDI